MLTKTTKEGGKGGGGLRKTLRLKRGILTNRSMQSKQQVGMITEEEKVLIDEPLYVPSLISNSL